MAGDWPVLCDAVLHDVVTAMIKKFFGGVLAVAVVLAAIAAAVGVVFGIVYVAITYGGGWGMLLFLLLAGGIAGMLSDD